MTALYTAIHCYAASQVVAGKFLPLFYAPLYWDYDTYFYSSPNWKKVLFQRVKNHCFSESTFFQNFYLTYSGNNHIIFVWIWSSNFPNVFWMKFDWLIFKLNISVKFLKNKFVLLKNKLLFYTIQRKKFLSFLDRSSLSLCLGHFV